jgi:hypothetical protein
MYTYTPADIPDLPAGWEINLYESGDYINLSLWRVRALLKPFKETRYADDALHYSGSRYADAYLPVGYTQEDLNEAIQELVWKATQLEDMVDESYTRYGLDGPSAANRPSFEQYVSRRGRNV